MSQRKLTLPRHTVLASQGSRIGAFLVDLAVLLGFTLAFFFGCFKLIVDPIVKPINEGYIQEEVNSGLRFIGDDGIITEIKSDASFEEFRDTISYYYMNYLTGVNVDADKEASRNANQLIDGVEKKNYYVASWFNKTVLGISNNPDAETDKGLFTYVKNGESYNKDVIGVPKTTSTTLEVNQHMQKEFLKAFKDFSHQDYVIELSDQINFLYSLEFVLAAFVGGIVTYIILPILFKNGVTIGKKSFGLALANKDGYKFDNKQLIMRFMPFSVVLFSLLIPIWSDVFFVMLVFMVIFLTSFALAMASPKRASLHDFCSGTIVIDAKASIIFDDQMSEEEYIFKEDGIEKEVIAGEEPDISYEK